MIHGVRKLIIHRCFFGSEKSSQKPLVDYNQRGQFRSPLALKVGDAIDGFQVTKSSKLTDFQIEFASLKSRKEGIQWVHFDSEEETNTLAMVVKCKEAPQFIKMALQKMLQQGSHKYPVCNPIQFMTRRSFNPENFGYATEDYILYAYQTSLLHDHSNLMSVFLNMLFHPLLREEDFKECVWRYELHGSNLQVVGNIIDEFHSTRFYSESKVYNAIRKQLYKNSVIESIGDVTKYPYDDIIQWYDRLFRPQNLLMVSHGDLHPSKLIQNFRKITQQFKWKQSRVDSKTISKDEVNGMKNQLQESKTIKIQHLDPVVPMVLSFKLENVSPSDKIMLSILTYILFDMPNALFMKWISSNTPYPKHYGYQGNHFNISISLEQNEQSITDLTFLQHQKLIRQELQALYLQKIPNSLIQKCLLHLQSEYFTRDGIKLITGCIDGLVQLGPSYLQQALNVKVFISKLLRSYRKEDIFEKLLKRYIIDNPKYVRIWGKVNSQLIQDTKFEDNLKMQYNLRKLSEPCIQSIKTYKPAAILQDYRVLPKIDLNKFQIFEQKNPIQFQINEIPVHHVHKCDGIKITMKYDVTDIDEDQVKTIPILCQTFPWMGAKGISKSAYQAQLQHHIRNIDMKFQTIRTAKGMRLYLLLMIQFSERNAEHGFNLFNNLLNDHNEQNIQTISQRLRKRASQVYNELTTNLVEIHGRHIGATRSPYSMMEDPLLMSRSVCNLAGLILKISNPKGLLIQVSHQISKISCKFKDKSRISVLFQCNKDKIGKYSKYLQVMLNQIKQKSQLCEPIDDKIFTPTSCLKYFPNYNEQFVFEAFTVPYYSMLQQIPASLVMTSIINQNIKTLNQSGGCFLFKGAMISYLRGSRKKVLEFEDYYRKLENIEQAKRFIFQKFRRYTAVDEFHTGVTNEQARNFKQAVAMVEEKDVQKCLQNHILPSVKSGASSILAIGGHLGNYEPLFKKGWTIQRSIQDMSLNMESESSTTPQIQMSKYINIY